MRPVDLGVLGPLVLHVHGAPVALPARAERTLLAALALRRGRPVPADRLAEDVWGDDLPATWRKGVQVGVSRLRRRLADTHPDAAGLVVTAADGYALSLDPDGIDAVRLERAADEGRRLLARGEAERAHATLQAGLALWRGAPFPELAERAGGQAEGARLTEIRDALTDRWYEATIERGDVDAAIAGLEASLVEDPLRERRWSLLMLALYRAGRQNDALRAFQRARTVLAEELGLAPGPELRQLEAAILAHDPALEAATRRHLVAAGHLEPDGSPAAPAAPAGEAPARTGRTTPPPPRRDPLGDPLEWARPLTRLPRRGRADELDRLLGAWGRVAAGQGGMVTLTGDPLSGKSRLAAELALAAEADGALVLAGRCVPGMGLASFVGTAATRDLVPIDDLVPGSAQAFTLGLEVAAMAYEEAAKGRPVLAILDDAHHADPEVINLFRHLAERPVAGDASLPAAALVVQRAGQRPPPGMAEWLAQGRRLPVHEDVTVAPLDAPAAAAVLADCLGDEHPAPEPELHAVAARAGGRPGYLVELGLHLRRGGDPDEVPPTLRALVEAHLGAQDDVVQRVVQAAAVTGPRFAVATAATAAGLDEDTTLDALERAVAARLLDEVDGAPGEHAFCAEADRLVLLGRLTNARRAVIEGRLAG